MIFTCLSTGSDGNAFLLESEKAVLIIEAGKGTFKKIIAALPENKKVIEVIYSHEHNDHFGDIEKIGKMFDILQFNENRYEDEFFIIRQFPVLHDVECFGFAIFCKEEKKTMLFMTDFAQVIEKSIYNLKVDFLAIELSYNEFLLKDLTDDQKYGLKWHSSDFHTIAIMRKYFGTNPQTKAVTLHKSNRACNHAFTNKLLFDNFKLRAEIVNIGRKYNF